jgi:hypothetical protein
LCDIVFAGCVELELGDFAPSIGYCDVSRSAAATTEGGITRSTALHLLELGFQLQVRPDDIWSIDTSLSSAEVVVE